MRAEFRCRTPPALMWVGIYGQHWKGCEEHVYLVRALVYLLEMVLAVSGVTMTLTAESQPPTDGRLLGSVPVLSLPGRTLKLTRGTGPTLHTYWKGYWTLAS